MNTDRAIVRHTWREVRHLVRAESNGYSVYLPLRDSRCPLWVKLLISRIKSERVYWVIRWQTASRWCDYWQDVPSIFGRLLYAWFVRKRNHLALKLGMEMMTKNIGPGLRIAHTQGIVINGQAVIGKNFHLMGNNCIGKRFESEDACPHIGDDVVFSFGAKAFGDIRIASGCRVGAGGTVLQSFNQPGSTLVGTPARQVGGQGRMW